MAFMIAFFFFILAGSEPLLNQNFGRFYPGMWGLVFLSMGLWDLGREIKKWR